MSGRVVKLLVEVADSDCFNVDEEEDEEECSLRNEVRILFLPLLHSKVALK